MEFRKSKQEIIALKLIERIEELEAETENLRPYKKDY